MRASPRAGPFWRPAARVGRFLGSPHWPAPKIWPLSRKICQKLAKFSQKLDKIGQKWPKLAARTGPRPRKVSPRPARARKRQPAARAGRKKTGPIQPYHLPPIIKFFSLPQFYLDIQRVKIPIALIIPVPIKQYVIYDY